MVQGDIVIVARKPVRRVVTRRRPRLRRVAEFGVAVVRVGSYRVSNLVDATTASGGAGGSDAGDQRAPASERISVGGGRTHAGDLQVSEKTTRSPA